MQRPDAFLWCQKPFLVDKNQNLCSRDGLEGEDHLNRVCNRLKFKKFQEKMKRDENVVNLLKEELARITKSNQKQKKIQIKLINQLKQKNLEYHYYKRELLKERRLHYLLKLETDGTVTRGNRVTLKRYSFGEIIVSAFQRWMDAILSLLWLHNLF